MEDTLQQVSNEHRSIYFALQLRLMDITQSIKLMGASFKENELKTVLADMVSHSYMLQGIFQEANIPHIYQLVKSIVINFNSATAILLYKLEKATQREASLLQAINARQTEDTSTGKNDEQVVGNGSLMKQIKKNRLGGIHLFNQNYSRYLQDQKILEQIHTEKQKRLQSKRRDILSQSILQELSHQTDVEELPANSDDIANYIIQTKDKNSMFNYVSYEPELQDILGFFQRSQQEASEFLMRKMRDTGEEEGQFSFADFQRDIHNKNSQMRRQVVEKMARFTDKYRAKEKGREDYIHQKEEAFKQAERSRMQRCHKQTETQINFGQYLQGFDKQIKDLTDKCTSLETMGKEHFNNDNQNELKRQLIQKQGEIDKLIKKIAQLELAIDSVKHLLKDQRAKKVGSVKDIDYKSQRTIPQPAPFVEKEKKVYVPPKEKTAQSYVLMHNKTGVQPNDPLAKPTSNQNGNKQISNSASFLSFQDVDRDRNGREVLKPEKKITVRYQQKKRTTHLQADAKLPEMGSKEALPLKQLEDKHTVKFQDKIVQKSAGTQQVIQKLQGDNSAQNGVQPREKSTHSPNKASVSTPKQSSTSILQKTKRSIKKIPENGNTSSKTTKTAAPSLKKIKVEQRKNNPNSLSTDSVPISEAKSQNTIKQAQYIEPSLMQDDNLQPSMVPQVQAQQSDIFQPSAKSDSKKVIAPYDMYEVTEEDEQTAKPSLNNSNLSSTKAFPAKQKELLGKLNAQLKKIAQQKNLGFSHQYSLTITRQKQLNTENGSIIRTQTQESQNTFHKDKAHRRVMKLFDSLLQNEGGFNQSKAQKLKRWKKAMMSHLKSQTLSQDQGEQILSIIKGSSDNKNTSFYENAISSIASVSHHIRNSLPQIQQITNLSTLSIKSKLPNLKKVKPRQRLQENQEPVVKEESRCILLTQFQQQMDELITHQSLEHNFHQKFNHLHKHCDQGALCTHVTKYFQSIMHHFQEAKKKGRRSIALPVQQIGVRNRLEQEALNRQPKPSQHNRSVRIDKPYDKGGANRNYSLTKHRYSQQSILPSIKEPKFSSNGSSSGLKHVF